VSTFVNQLRARGEPVRMVAEGAPSITVRVELAETWDTVRVIASPSEPVLGVKVRALSVLAPSADFHEEFVLKLKGWEVFDEESTSLAAAGAVDGSTFLLQHRHRRAVR
jgi:hypothetical protein